MGEKWIMAAMERKEQENGERKRSTKGNEQRERFPRATDLENEMG